MTIIVAHQKLWQTDQPGQRNPTKLDPSASQLGPLGSVRYTEQMAITLRSLTPIR
jgi:hypothetical protein